MLSGDVFADNGSGEDDPDGPVAPVVSAVNGNAGSVGNQITLLSGALLTLNADGTFDYDPNGAFDALPGPASGAPNTATDSFTYTLASGGAATVTVTINGEDSDDTLVGAPGGQNLDGGVGDDTIDYSASPTAVEVRISTGQGLGGDAQGDTYTDIENVIGSAFADVIVGGDQSSTLEGGDGNDTILGRGQSDTLLGGDGDDLLDGEAGADVLNGGDGVDTASYFGSPAGVQVRLTTGAGLGGQAQGDTLISIENLVGGAFDDLFVGSDGVGNVLDGHDGNDTLIGRSGDDLLEGRDGNDLLDGGLGADILRGGDGVDTASYFNSATGVTVSLLTGLGFGGEAEGDRLTFIENLLGSAHGDTLTGSNGIDNLLRGGEGADTLIGLSGADILEGGGADDILDGGPGADILRGGAGFDTVRYTGQAAVAVDLRTGLGGGAAAGDRYNSIERAIGSNFNDTLTAVNGINVTLEGAIGDDTLLGQGGNDTLIGGLGADDLFGGLGDDIFVFLSADDSKPGQRDELLDFEARVGEDDTIDLRGFAGTLTFIGAAAFSAANQVRLHDDPGPHLTIEINTIGSTGAESAITLLNTAIARIDASDFLLGDFII